MKLLNTATFLLFGVVLAASCSKQAENVAIKSQARPLMVYTVNYPIKYFAQRIAGDHADVRFPSNVEGDPAYWSPDHEYVSRCQKSSLVLLNGADYAKWVSKVSLPSSKTIDTSAAFHDRLIELKDQGTHAHGPEGEHAHRGWAFTTWLDPSLAVEHARAIKDALSAKRPAEKLKFAERFAELQKELMEIDAQLKATVSANKDLPVIFSHPVYQYMERRYGVNGKSVHWEPDAAPTDEMWAELKELLKTHPAKWMIWEGAPGEETVRKLKEVGLESVVFDPCGAGPASDDYLSTMRQNVTELEKVFGAE
jgi:zinc transport system substrate-binding protein